MRFELTPPKRIELESIALDHSAMNALCVMKAKKTKDSPVIALSTLSRKKKKTKNEASGGIRTHDPLLTRQVQ